MDECGSLKVRGQDSNHTRWPPVKRDGLPQDIGPRAKSGPPDAVGKQNGLGFAGRIILTCEVGPEQWGDSQGGEKRRLHRSAGEPRRLGIGEIAVADAGPGRDGFEARVMSSELEITGAEQEVIRQHGRRKSDRYEPVSLAIRQTAEE